MQNEIQYITVSELNRRLNFCVEKQFPNICVEGEISDIKRAGSGHVYFTLKDAKCQISAVMWRGTAQGLKFTPEPGLAVLCHARPTIYPEGGRLQIIVQQMLPSGEGLLRKKFLEMKERLEKEGLSNPERKRKIPYFPRAIGVVTSAQGAVIHDIMIKIRERMPILKVHLADVRVQGEGAAEEIAQGIKQLSESGMVEAIIVARGGGSLEDLWAFNEEAVVRAIFASSVPVISGVGHEVDFTLSDFAADLRAPTPTAAAEAVVPRRDDLLKEIAGLETRLMRFDRWLQPLIQRLDEREMEFHKKGASYIKQQRLLFERFQARVQAIQPGKILALLESRIDLMEQRLESGGKRLVVAKRHVLERIGAKLEAVSPRRVLERGFSVVQSGGKVVSSASALKPDQSLTISFFEGSASARVEKVGG